MKHILQDLVSLLPGLPICFALFATKEKKNLISLVESRGMIVHVCVCNGNPET